MPTSFRLDLRGVKVVISTLRMLKGVQPTLKLFGKMRFFDFLFNFYFHGLKTTLMTLFKTPFKTIFDLGLAVYRIVLSQVIRAFMYFLSV